MISWQAKYESESVWLGGGCDGVACARKIEKGRRDETTWGIGVRDGCTRVVACTIQTIASMCVLLVPYYTKWYQLGQANAVWCWLLPAI